VGEERRVAHDFQIATPGIAAKAVAESIYKRKRFSDHAPSMYDLDFPASSA
jgi:exodeoxyribonuclease-3